MQQHYSLAEQTFVVLDLETTGLSAVYDRILEVAALRVRGGSVVARFEALVDPGTTIPPLITRLTGIGAAMVRGRPRIEELLQSLREFVGDAPVVAHNLSFDYAFLANAFARAGIAWQAERICTLRLARRLVPGLPSYRLDCLCAHLNFPFVQNHRAAPDAEATVSLLGRLLALAARRGVDHVPALLELQAKPGSRRASKGNVDEAQVATLPGGPGVYLLKDASGHIVYVGKSIHVRQRVRQHLRPSGTAQSAAQPRLRKRLRQIADVQGIETGSEIAALLLESKLVKQYLPEGNCQLRDYRNYTFIKVDHRDGYPRLEATRERPNDGAVYFGPFKRGATAASAVLFLSEQLGLRQCRGQLLPGGSACPLLELAKCLGPCVDSAVDGQYAGAVAEAERILRGDDQALIDRTISRRDELAEELRFEEAIELRDRVRDLESVIRVVQRLRSVGERNLVIVAPVAVPGSARVFAIRCGRLAGEFSVPFKTSSRRLRLAIRTMFRGTANRPVTREEVDDMLILDAWLRQERSGSREFAIPIDEPESVVSKIQQTLRSLSAGSQARGGHAVRPLRHLQSSDRPRAQQDSPDQEVGGLAGSARKR